MLSLEHFKTIVMADAVQQSFSHKVINNYERRQPETTQIIENILTGG